MQAIQIKLMRYLIAAVCHQAVLPHCNLQRLVAKSFCRKCTLQQPFSKSFGCAAFCSASKTIWREGNSTEKWTKTKSFRPAAICSAFSQKILDEIHIAAASHKKFWTKCTLQLLLTKGFDPLHFAGPSLKKFGATALLQQLRHKNSGGNAPCSILLQDGLAVHGYAGAICKMGWLRQCG